LAAILLDTLARFFAKSFSPLKAGRRISSPVAFFLHFQGHTITESSKRGKKKGSTMNPLIQLNRQLQHLFIALLLACFAIAQSARAVTQEPDGGDPNGNTAEGENAVLDLSTDTESGAMGQLTAIRIGDNKWVIPISFANPLPCAGGDVTFRGNLVVTFKHLSVGVVEPTSLELATFTGVAATGNRKLVAAKDVEPTRIQRRKISGKGYGTFNFEFEVAGPGITRGVALAHSG
jgi:hypothetical protein